MKIFKFGGASLKNPENLIQIKNIISAETNLVVVVSAIDKTTNALEEVINSFFFNYDNKFIKLEKVKKYHEQYIDKCFNEDIHKKTANSEFNEHFQDLVNILNCNSKDNYDRYYDSIICFGEIFSSVIVTNFLKYSGIKSKLVDIRKILYTDSNYRDAKILWNESEEKLKKYGLDFSSIIITQGFIGEDLNGIPTSLGREGSDYTASALSYLLNAESVTIWKDVPGIMNADPSWCNFAEKLDVISYREAIELAFYGAKVIHPKTIKPLENKNIPLFVKSFVNPDNPGTVVKKLNYRLNLMPIYILKENQILLSLSPLDFSFIVEENLSKIFSLFAKYKIKINIMQNSAISFSVSIDGNNRNFELLVNELQKEFSVKYNSGAELVTIRYYTDDAIKRMIEGKKILLVQKSRNTARYVLQRS